MTSCSMAMQPSGQCSLGMPYMTLNLCPGVCAAVCAPVHLSMFSVHLGVHLSDTNPSVCAPVHLSVHLSVCLFILSLCLCSCLCSCPSVYAPVHLSMAPPCLSLPTWSSDSKPLLCHLSVHPSLCHALPLTVSSCVCFFVPPRKLVHDPEQIMLTCILQKIGPLSVRLSICLYTCLSVCVCSVVSLCTLVQRPRLIMPTCTLQHIGWAKCLCHDKLAVEPAECGRLPLRLPLCRPFH